MIHQLLNGANIPTPALIFLQEKIEERLTNFAALSKKYPVHFLFAVKSTLQSKLLDLSNKYLSGFDISNKNEYARLPKDLNGKRVFLTSPIATSDIDSLRDNGNYLFLMVDGYQQAILLDKHDSYDKFALRLNSGEFLSRHGFSSAGCHVQSRFGFGVDDLDLVHSLAEKHRERFAGLHFHHGGESNPAELCIALAKEAALLLQELKLGEGFVDFGGGFHELSFSELEKLIVNIRTILPPKIEIVFEPGRAITEGCGYALTKVREVRVRQSVIECVVDLSMECHLKWSSPQLLSPGAEKKGESTTVMVYGPTCFEGDFIGEFQIYFRNGEVSPIRPGDKLLFSSITSYCEAWNRGFNGIEKCRVELI